MRHLTIQRADDGFATIILDNADESVNLVSDEFVTEMTAATAEIAADDRIKGVILKSGKAGFMAGADLKLLVQGFGTLTPKEAYAFSQRATAMHRAMEMSGKPTTALGSSMRIR